MPNVIDEAVEALRNLVPERGEELARFMLRLAANDADPEPIDPARLPAVLEGLAQARRGRFASPERIEAAFRSFEKT